jgi:hypothetical protein
MIAASPPTAGSLYVANKSVMSRESNFKFLGIHFGRALLAKNIIGTITYDVERVTKNTPMSRTSISVTCLKDGMSGEVRHTIINEVSACV